MTSNHMATVKKTVKKAVEKVKKATTQKGPTPCTDCGGTGLQDRNTLCLSCEGTGLTK